ncbi:gamma-tubulin complex component 3 [Drosophila tropicalis]|uniref:gamma-tubulin complex component 3 n=1 Tax=Drosophila tropicalis TaxID=46794 RepID=UPI0035ABE1A2
MSQQQGRMFKDITERNNQLYLLISELCSALHESKPSPNHHLVVNNAMEYIAQCPSALSKAMPFTEIVAIQRITDLVNAQVMGNDCPRPGELFDGLYETLISMSVVPSMRLSLLNFFLCLLMIDCRKKEEEALTLQLSPTSVATSDDNLTIALSMLKTNKNNGYTNGYPSEIYRYEPTQTDSVDAYTEELNLTNYPENLGKQKNIEAMHDVVQNAIYSFTGVEGKYLKRDIVTGRFKLDPLNQDRLTSIECGMLVRLSELGYYHDRVVKFSTISTGFNAMGCMGQAFIALLKEELTQFHGQVAQLHDQLHSVRRKQMIAYMNHQVQDYRQQKGELTLMKLLTWQMEPLHRMQWLTKIADACQMKKGGELASVVYNYLDNGNPMVNRLAHELLTAICGPLVRMISKWMLEGGISDPCGEFFVESLDEVGADRLWHDKFRLRLHMLPKFIPIELAHKILKTGKGINFLREVCEMDEMVKGREKLKKIIDNQVSDIFSCVQDSSWHAAIETSYQQTSKHVLDIMLGPHKLLDHLHGMRRYLLLGQGDFVNILIENMKEELERLGTEIYAHDLSAMLDAALRCTNAQYDDPEILNHLDVVVQTPYPGDYGWDIISLQYTVEGPLATMLEPTMPTYKALFKPLWRMKHMEFLLSMKIWKEQMANAKALRSMHDEIGKACYRLHLFTSETMHFVHQIQYYVLFEVIECNWVELQKRMQQATALDDILEAHEKFLSAITVGCFVNTMTDMERHLDTVYDNIICLESWQSSFYRECFKELEAREKVRKRVAESELTGGYGLTTEQKIERDHELKMFEQRVISACRNLDEIATAYEKAVSGFLLALNSDNDPNLQLFGTRLDFNEYYKKRDTSLSKPLTFEHKRMSNLFSINSKSFIGARSTINSQISLALLNSNNSPNLISKE